MRTMFVVSGVGGSGRPWPARTRARHRRTGPRWLAAARALRSRYRMRAERTPRSERVLLRRERGTHVRVAERWVLAARARHPRVCLTVQPLLRLQFAWTAPPLPHGDARGPEGRRPADTRARRVPPVVVRTPPAHPHVTNPRATAVSIVAPCVRVFERARERRPLAAAQVEVFRAQAAAASLSTRRERLRRREDRRSWSSAPPAVVQRERASAPGRADDTAVPRHWSDRVATPAPRTPAVPALADVGALPAPQLQALTDRVVQQIDRRLSAWRERSGLA